MSIIDALPSPTKYAISWKELFIFNKHVYYLSLTIRTVFQSRIVEKKLVAKIVSPNKSAIILRLWFYMIMVIPMLAQ